VGNEKRACACAVDELGVKTDRECQTGDGESKRGAGHETRVEWKGSEVDRQEGSHRASQVRGIWCGLGISQGSTSSEQCLLVLFQQLGGLVVKFSWSSFPWSRRAAMAPGNRKQTARIILIVSARRRRRFAQKTVAA
jgi:hypothetical protein